MHEVNFDGLIGPTHNYAGLAPGNLASRQHQHQISRPRQAALQGLAKMKLLADLGVKQAVLPPHPRPDLGLLRRLGFAGCDTTVIEQADRHAPELLAAAYSASSMWVANAATVSPSPDTDDHRVHVTPANLATTLHRSIEAQSNRDVLRVIFHDQSIFQHHPTLPACNTLRDEGAANHTRLCPVHNQPGIELFVYGQPTFDAHAVKPRLHPTRQTLEASLAIARLHGLNPSHTLFVQQHPHAIDAGVFHNDVICVGHRNLLLYHQQAFVDTPSVIGCVSRAYATLTGEELTCLQIPSEELTLHEAVTTYLFNSQIVTPSGKSHSLNNASGRRHAGRIPGGGGMVMICPVECETHAAARRVLERLVEQDNPIGAVHFVDLRQSMHNGGGPACLRLRVPLSDEQLASTNQGVYLTEKLYTTLTQWVHRHYRDELHPDGLADPKLLDESRRALDELTSLLKLGPMYPFQKMP